MNLTNFRFDVDSDGIALATFLPWTRHGGHR